MGFLLLTATAGASTLAETWMDVNGTIVQRCASLNGFCSSDYSTSQATASSQPFAVPGNGSQVEIGSVYVHSSNRQVWSYASLDIEGDYTLSGNVLILGAYSGNGWLATLDATVDAPQLPDFRGIPFQYFIGASQKAYLVVPGSTVHMKIRLYASAHTEVGSYRVAARNPFIEGFSAVPEPGSLSTISFAMVGLACAVPIVKRGSKRRR